jgi:hypothetical protein
MSMEDTPDLQRRVEALERENAALRERLAVEPGKPVTTGSKGTVAGGPRRRPWGWTLLATVLVVIGSLLAPVAVVAAWARVELTDTSRFVAAYAPLANNPDFQSYITDETVAVINQHVDIPKLTSDGIDGIVSLGTGPVATRALKSFQGPIAAGIESLLQSRVAGFVASDAFATVWTDALRITHAQLVATMENNPQSAVTLGSDGTVGIQLAPIIAAVKTALVNQGLTIANNIPAVNRTITVAQSSQIPTLQLAYNLAVVAGTWLPWVALAFLIAGVLVARRRSLALVWTAVALALVMVVILAAVAIGSVAFIASVSPSVLPSNVASVLFNVVVDGIRATAVSVLVLAVAVAVVAWLAGPFRVPRKLRGFFGSGAAQLRSAAARHGLSTGATGRWLYSQRVLLRVVIAAIAAVIVVFVRPLTPGLVIWTLVIAVLVVAILEVVQLPGTSSSDADEPTTATTAG